MCETHVSHELESSQTPLVMESYVDSIDEWFQFRNWPSPVGLSMGLGMVIVWQIIVIGYYFLRREGHRRYGVPKTIQYVGPEVKTLDQELWAHLSAPESFFMVFGYAAFDSAC